MTHQPQQILIKVMCSERLPDVKGYQLCDDSRMFQFYYFNDITRYWYTNPLQFSLVFPTVWYEPATRIVLTVEEYMELEKKILDVKKEIAMYRSEVIRLLEFPDDTHSSEPNEDDNTAL